MTHTATPIFTSEGVTQFELDPLMVIDGYPIRYVIGLTMSDDFGAGRDVTLVYAADADGCGDAAFFVKNGYIAEHYGFADIPRAIKALGYDTAPLLRLVTND